MMETLLSVFVVGVMIFAACAVAVLGVEAVRVFRLLRAADGPEAFERADSSRTHRRAWRRRHIRR